ncbi:MAG: hypothetical protein ACRD01_14215 [Terriglobales bacterium]
MQHLRLPFRPLAGAAAVALLASLAFGGPRADYTRPIMQTIPAAGLSQVVLQNLVGPITVTMSSDDQVHLTILVHSGGADQAFAQTLSQQLTFTVKKYGPQLRILGVYPLDHFRDYGYPKMKSVFGIHGTDSNIYDGQKVFIRNVSNSRAIELWAEIRIQLPPRVALVIRNTYGDVTLKGGDPTLLQGLPAGNFDGFTDVGDFSIYRPLWSQMKIESDYGKVEFNDGLGATHDIHLKTDVGGAYLDLPANSNAKIVAHKDLGFLHNDITAASFTKNSQGDSVLSLGTGQGAVVHIDMSVGSLHLKSLGS